MAESKIFAGPRIRRIRNAKGLTQTAMAEGLGISPSYLNLIERNQRPLTVQLILKLASIYKVEPEELQGEAGGSIAALREVFADPLLAGELPGEQELIEIAEGANIQDLAMVHADPGFPCIVGRRVTIGHRAILHGCTVEDGCMIGMGEILLNGVRLGAGSVVGAGAVLTEGTEVPPGSLVLGVPGKVVRPVDEAMRGRIEHAWTHYVIEAAKHRRGDFPLASTGAPP